MMRKRNGIDARVARAAAVVINATAAEMVQHLEQRVLLAAVTGDAKHGNLSKLGDLGTLYSEYQAYATAHGGSGAGFVPKEKYLVLDGDGLAIETYTNPAYSPKTPT